MRSRFVQCHGTHEPDDRGHHQGAFPPPACRGNERHSLERRDHEEDVARALAPLLVLADRGTRAGHALDGPMGVRPGPHGQHGAERSGEQEHGGRGRCERRPAGEGHPPEQHSREQQRDREVHDCWMQCGEGHGRAPLGERARKHTLHAPEKQQGLRCRAIGLDSPEQHAISVVICGVLRPRKTTS